MSVPTKGSELTKGSAGQFVEGNEGSAHFVEWPTSQLQNGPVELRAIHFCTLQKQMSCSSKWPHGYQAATLLDLMTIRAFHSKSLRCYSLGSALGFRIRGGVQTDIPAIIVFVARKVHRHWLYEAQELPLILEGPGGIWCDVDVVEFSLLGPQPPLEPVHTELVEGLQGRDATIGSGSQVACYELYGTLGAIVRSRTGLCQVGFLTNRHVAVSLDHPVQKLFYPLPPHLGPGVYLGAVERTTTFIRDDLWYGVFASMNPESFARADGAFIPFDNNLDVRNFVSPSVRGVGEIGEVMSVDLHAPLNSLIGEAEGKPRPIGMVWGGTTHQGRLKFQSWKEPEKWTSGVDLSRLLDSLELSIVSSNEALCEALEMQRQCLAASLHQPPSCLTIRSPLSTMLHVKHALKMDRGFLKFDFHDAVKDTVPSETLKDLLSTATFETSATQADANEHPMLSTSKDAFDPSSRQIQSVRKSGTNSLHFNTYDPFELSLSSPLSGIEQCSNHSEWPQRMIKACQLCFQHRAKRTRQLADSGFLEPNS